MTLNHCTDPTVGSLLHAYELRILSPEDDERFEIHMLQCSVCFTEAMEFASNAALLRTDSTVRAETERIRPSVTYPAGLSKRLRRYLWPVAPLVYRPAFSLLLILLLLYPAYLGLRPHKEADIRPVTLISLSSNRSGQPESITVPGDKDLLLVFYFEGTEPRKQYVVTMSDEFGTILFHDDSFSDFDMHSVATIIVPSTRVDAGPHTLTVVDPGSPPPGNRQEYTFTVNR